MRNDKEEAEKRGLKILREAMSLGREQGIVNCFGWRPDVMPRLCMKALDAGIEVSYVQHLIRIRHLVPDTPPLECENWPWPLRIFTLGRFSIFKEDTPVQFSGKVQRKPLELLKAIISLGGIDVPEDRVTDLLWPDTEGDLAHQNFGTTLHRLRRLIGNDAVIKLQGGQLTIDARYCWVDIWAFERIAKHIEGIFDGIREEGKQKNWEISHTPDVPLYPVVVPYSEIQRLIRKVLDIYKGVFLPADTSCLWTFSLRERLRNRFIRVILLLGGYLERTEQLQKVMELYESAIGIDDLAEEFYLHLMVCYHRFGQQTEAVKVYRRLQTVLSAAFGIEPSPSTQAIFKKLTEL